MADISKINPNGTEYNLKDEVARTTKAEAIEITITQYEALSTAEKNDPTKIYFITDYPSGSGVVINPTGTATDTAETIEVDGTIYDFAGTDAEAVHTADIGVAGGVAELDANGKVPSSQLPSYVDDVVEYASISAFPATGESGKIYIALDTNKTYRWTGSVYVEISPSLALGETSSTAYRGDRGKTAYDHSQSDHSGIAPAFTEASTRANIASGETFATLLGKIKKFFSDLKAVAFSGSYNDLSDKPIKLSDFTDDVVSGHYLPLTGGTLTGNLNVSGSSDTSLYTHGNASGSYIGFRNQAGNTTFGYIGVQNDNLPYFYANGSKRIALTSDITDEKVTATEAEPSSETVYDLLTVPHSSQTTNQQPSVNTDSKAYIKQGTAGSVGWVYLSAGNNTPTGTAGNKYGALRLYSEKSGYVDLATNAASTNGRAIRFPDANGVLALTTDSGFTKRFGLDFWLASSMKGKWYTVLSKAYNYSPSQELIIHISNLNYSNSNGTSKMFVVHSHYRNLTIHPIGADANYVSWMVNWRTTYDSSNIYLEFQVKSDLSDSVSNQFRISYITLTDNTSFTVPTSLVESSGRTVIDTYTLNENFRTLTPNDNIASATKATQDGDGNTIKSTYLKLSGGTLTGNVFSTAGYLGIGRNSSGDSSTEGVIHIGTGNGKWLTLRPISGTGAPTIYWPSTGGTLALTSDIPSVPSQAETTRRSRYTMSTKGAWTTVSYSSNLPSSYGHAIILIYYTTRGIRCLMNEIRVTKAEWEDCASPNIMMPFVSSPPNDAYGVYLQYVSTSQFKYYVGSGLQDDWSVVIKTTVV